MGTAAQFSAHIYCGQTTGYIKMPLGTKVGLFPGDIALDGDPVSPKRGIAAPTFRPMSIVAKRLDGWRCQRVYGGIPRSTSRCFKWGPSSPPQFSVHVCCGQTAGRINMKLGMEVGFGPGHILLETPKVGHTRPISGLYVLWSNGWIYQDANNYQGRPLPRRVCVRRGPSPPKNGA